MGLLFVVDKSESMVPCCLSVSSRLLSVGALNPIAINTVICMAMRVYKTFRKESHLGTVTAGALRRPGDDAIALNCLNAQKRKKARQKVIDPI